MKMASAKLQELGSINAELEEKLAGRTDDEKDATIERLNGEIREAEARVRAAEDEGGRTKGEGAKLSSEIMTLKGEIASKDEWMVQAQGALEKAAKEKEERANGGDVPAELEELRAMVAQLQGESEQLRSEAVAKDEWMKNASASIAEITKERSEFVELMAKIEEENGAVLKASEKEFSLRLARLEAEKDELAKKLVEPPPSSPDRLDSIDLGSPTNGGGEEVHVAKVDKLEEEVSVLESRRRSSEMGRKLCRKLCRELATNTVSFHLYCFFAPCLARRRSVLSASPMRSSRWQLRRKTCG